MKVAPWRLAAGVAVLVLLALIGVRLLPPYLENFEFQRYLDALVSDPASATLPVDQLNAKVLAKSTSLALPITAQDVHITRTESEFKIEVLYLVKIDLQAYTVDLHFRPAAGGA